jgi:hypothetical protein
MLSLLTRSVVRLEAALHPLLIVAVVLALNVFWTVTLQAFDLQFRAVAGLPLLDLQNTTGILTPQEALALVAGYSIEARSFYWVFFILDNIVPLVAFGSFAVLWAALLRRTSLAAYEWVQRTPLLLIPFGVGCFDSVENLAFLVAIHQPTATFALTAMQLGLGFVWLKAICLFATFGLTPALLVVCIVAAIRRRLARAVRRAA